MQADRVKQSVTEWLRGHLGPRRATLSFVAAWALLDVMLNLRYPADEPAFWYLIPTIDVVVLFAYFALFARLNFELPRALRVALVLWLFLVRLIRVGDGFQTRYFAERFNLWSDLRLAPELVRFVYSTFSVWALLGLVVAVPALVGTLFLCCYRALQHCERYLAEPRHLKGVGVVVASFFLLGVIPHDPHYRQLYWGGFGASSIPRLRHEAKFLLNVSGYRTESVKAIADVQARLARGPGNLAKLRGRNVHLILIESYGNTVFERPDFVRRTADVFEKFERELGARGFSLATGLLDSPTSGGRSWLAQATLATGVRTADQLQYELLLASRPKPLARFFRDAGYRTVLAQPGTTRPWPKGEVFAFEQRYFAWNFDYAGPPFAWATMPDQYVLDFVRRRELGSRSSPLFIEYVLVSSHAPWSHQPIVVDDWERVGNGAIYDQLEMVRFPIEWPYFKEASEAYIRSIIYDLEVLERYIAQFVSDDSLLILLGDHQPIPEVAGEGASVSVPVHVLSREAALVAPFRARGYASGMRPASRAPHPPMSSFLPDFLRDFSTEP